MLKGRQGRIKVAIEEARTWRDQEKVGEEVERHGKAWQMQREVGTSDGDTELTRMAPRAHHAAPNRILDTSWHTCLGDVFVTS